MNDSRQQRRASSDKAMRYWRLALWGAAAALWLLPLIAMQFTTGVAWTPLDFLVFGTMLAIAGGLCEFAVRVSGNTAYRAAIAVSAGAGFLLVWINIAVGVVGDEQNPANVLSFGVLVIAIVGGLIARFRPRGLIRSSLATAAAQAITGGIALANAAADTPTIVCLTLAFMALWALSAGLFWLSARDAATKPGH
jgi:hypothetical protein